ncbi:MAG: AAA family ATPase [Thiohalocapsa sp. PB-PSB1]|nr:MAG: AAA family ATPase [Thiohalocapsa sp. PB-PSB1]HCS88852.1 chromosome segregation protein SMC [Chromatiaceae bacterium]
MKLLELHLLAYGPFTDCRLDLSAGNEGLHILYGPNEAGKSSALRALRAWLYGVPERTRDDFRHAKTELRVGGLLRGADGSELRCYRRKGRKNTLVDEDSAALAEDQLTRLLGGVSEALFERLFGIDHEALVDGGQALLLERGREAEALFGTGLGSTAVHALLEKLEQEAQSLFAPRASKPLFNKGLSRLAEIKRQQSEASLSARHWDEARKAVTSASARLNEIDAELSAEETRRGTLERIRRSLPGLARRDHLRARLASLGAVRMLEDDFGARREQALSKRRLALEGRAKASARLEGLRQDMGGLHVSGPLLAEAEAVDELRERLGSDRKAARDRPGLVAERGMRLDQARQKLLAIGADLSIEEHAKLRPLLGRRRRASQLGARQEALETAVDKARESHQEALGKLAAKRDELAHVSPPVSHDELRQAVGEARRTGDVDGAIAEANAELARHRDACQVDLAALGLWTGDLAELPRLPLPGEQTVQKFADAFQASDEEQQRLQGLLSEDRRQQRQTEEALRALHLAGAVPTETDLQQARERRDFGWQLLRRHWVDGEDVSGMRASYTQGQSLPDAFEQGIANADEIADRLRRESRRVHDQAAAQAKLDACRQRIADAEQALSGLGQRRLELDQSWKQAWMATGICPLSPREMSDWLQQAGRLREKLARADELQARAAMLERTREARRNHLLRALLACGEAQPQGPGQQLGLLLDHAEARLAAIEQAARRRLALEESIADLDQVRRQRERELDSAEQALASWRSDWVSLMEELGRKETATPAEVSDDLETISDALALVDQAEQLKLRIDGIDSDARDFERDVAALLARLAPDLVGRSTNEAILQLDAELSRQREANSRLNELRKQAGQTEQEVREADAAIRAADDVLVELCRQAACENADELQAVEQRFKEHQELGRQLQDVEAELVDAGDGLSVEALASEAGAVDRDLVLAELTALNQRIDQELRPAREAQLENKLSAERDLRSMVGTDAASALAEQAQQTLSELRGHAEHYVRLKFAARVLRDEIEGFRRQHRDPILTRASAYFKTLTRGSLQTIETDFDESDQPVLVAVRPMGERLRVEAMSTGTRDQLYLALRLATLDQSIENAEPLPLIVDDILIQFDDQRAQATLGALADFSARTQVILFTHHERVAEEAQRLDHAQDRVFVHALG